MRGNRVLDISRAYGRQVNDKDSKRRNDTAGLIESLQALSASLLEIIKAGQETMAELAKLEEAAGTGSLEDCIFSLGDSPLVAPIPMPPLLLHFESHEGHVKSLHSKLHGDGEGIPDIWYQFPHYYYGNSHGLSGHNADIMFPDGEAEMDFELEFAAVIGQDISDVSAKEAEDAIVGYTIINDWAARSLERKCVSLGLGPTMAKNFATSMGPYLVTKDEVPDPYNLKMTVKINEEVVSTAMTHEARYSFGEMISFASEGNSLPAGTIICSGACANGCGAEIGRYLKSGDVVDLEIQDIGTLRNRVSDKRRAPVYARRSTK
ncbi:MAG: fumarylacetoacetate hydrolase family protein [Candidatus Sumerlaeota bacterium]